MTTIQRVIVELSDCDLIILNPRLQEVSWISTCHSTRASFNKFEEALAKEKQRRETDVSVPLKR